jgi:hypothetical protein
MKYFSILFVAIMVLGLSSTNCYGQNFEGVISYGVEYDVNLPDRPDLEMYEAMFPEIIELSIKGHNAMMKCKGGMAEGLIGDILYKAKEKNLYTLFPQTKTASQIPQESIHRQDKLVLDAMKTAETSTFLGVQCTKFVVRDLQEGTQTDIWCAKMAASIANLMLYFLETMTHYNIKGLEGLPLKIEFKGKEFNIAILPEQMERKRLASSFFTVPKDFKITKGN